MEPIQIIHLVFIILEAIVGTIGIIFFIKLSKKIKDDSNDDSMLTSKEKLQAKIFAVIVIVYCVISLVEIALRIINDIL